MPITTPLLLLFVAGFIWLAGCHRQQQPAAPSATPTATAAALSVTSNATTTVPSVPPTETTTPAGTTNAATGSVTLPEDDAPHLDVTTEWWYYNGHLRGPNGQRFGFHVVVFQVLLPGQAYGNVAHLSITDAQEGVYSTAQRASFTVPTGDNGPGFDLEVGGWRLSGHDGADVITAATDSYALDLRLLKEKRPVLHNRTGTLEIGEDGGTSHYYSRTRMAASGTLVFDGVELAVVGEAWFDHQWGDFDPVSVAWDWFALQLADGSDLMLSLLRSEEGRPLYRYGTLVDPDGTASHLEADDFMVEVTDLWTSPAGGATYPIAWRVRVPSFGLEIELAPVVRDSVFDATLTTGNRYWEGDVTATGSHPGNGFVEMTGYTPAQP